MRASGDDVPEVTVFEKERIYQTKPSIGSPTSCFAGQVCDLSFVVCIRACDSE
jgi:hypothetical protein